MDLTFALLTLRNARYPDLLPVEVEALVDTGATLLCVPASIASALQLATYDHKEADESVLESVDRGPGVYVITYQDGKPDQIYFGGYSFD